MQGQMQGTSYLVFLLDNVSTLIFGAVAGALVSIVIEKLIRAITGRIRLRSLQYVLPLSPENQMNEIFIQPSFVVLGGGKGGQSKRGYTHTPEVEAIVQLILETIGTQIKLNFRYLDDTTRRDSDWIVLGLSAAYSNLTDGATDTMRERFGVRICKPPEADKGHASIHLGNDVFSCTHVEDHEYGSRVACDYGIVCKMRLNHGRMMLICGGIHMFGTQAALETALSPEFISRVSGHRCSEFLQIVRAPVKKDGLFLDRSAVIWKTYPFVGLS